MMSNEELVQSLQDWLQQPEARALLAGMLIEAKGDLTLFIDEYIKQKQQQEP